MTERTPNTPNGEARKAQIAINVCAAFRVRDFEPGTSGKIFGRLAMSHLAEFAGVSRAGFYRSFDSRDEFHDFLVCDLLTNVDDSMQSTISAQVGTTKSDLTKACFIGAIGGVSRSIVGGQLFPYDDQSSLAIMLPTTEGGFVDRVSTAVLEVAGIDRTDHAKKEIVGAVQTSVLGLIGRNVDALDRGDVPAWPNWPDDKDVFNSCLDILCQAISRAHAEPSLSH